MTDERRDRARATETCFYCPTLCLFACPVSNAEGRDSVAPWGKMSLVRWIDRGVLPLDAESASFFYKCLGCLACTTPCLHSVDVPDVLFAARARAVAAGVSPFDAAPFRRDPDVLAERLRTVVPPDRLVDDAQALLLPGCETLLRTPEVVADTFALAERLGLDWLAAGEASALCCGYPLWAAGHLEEARAAATRLATAVRRYRKLVVLSPHCLYMLRVVYPALDIPLPPVQYAGDMLLEALRGRPLLRKVVGRVRYHDPCYLGRHLGIYATPRGLLAAACADAPGELRWHHDSSSCCGAGGGIEHTSPAVAEHAAAIVVENARGLGTDVLATACAGCAERFRTVPGAPVVKDVVTLLAEALVARR